ncbi:DUF5820 family protein [Halobiforma nitratireducens]|uniref:Uncharacterized protein n=1 Tax=Halobiforma nitratireducens JCM 10879 TaxID=1227454 RepID=M0L8L7_9EURY|nr:DUF5820 family protein [Halobiforma nitratireducens]EMA29423.1 hypothetical protein C446_17212 [Halobiforma nitratireducens JCM 10879]
MSDSTAFPDAWTVWSREEDGRLVLAYRPDIFDGDAFPAACLPTLYLTHGKRTRRPGTNPTTTGSDDWFVTLYLEPEVTLEGARRFSSRTAALECCHDLARSFDDGEVDFRGCYQVPRERYVQKLDDLTGDSGSESEE